MFIIRRSLLLLVFLSVIGVSSPSQARLRNFVAQPVAPNAFALSWKVTKDTAGVAFSVYRKYNTDDYVEVGTFDLGRTDCVDVVNCAPGDSLWYKLSEIDKPSGKVIKSLEAIAVSGTNLVANGDFEMAALDDAKVVNIGISLPKPWQAKIIKGGLEPGNKCLELKTPQAQNAPRFSITTGYYRICPDTKYTFNWHITETTQGCAGGVGQAYGYTKEGAASFYAKVASLYIYMSDRQGSWIEYWGQPKLPEDLHHAYIRLYTKGYYQPEPVLVDNIQIVDHDIELLMNTKLSVLIAQAREKAKAKQPWLSPEQVQMLSRELSEKEKIMVQAVGMPLDEFYDIRTSLCKGIRKLNRDIYLFKIAELKK